MKSIISKLFHRFLGDNNGSLSVEAVLAIPMLFWAATATFTFYDAFKMQFMSYRANYTISDMLSRKTDSMDQAYLDGIFDVFRYMTNTNSEVSWLRVSVVTCTSACNDEDNRVLEFDWSHGASGAADLVTADMQFVAGVIPLMATGNRVIFVQTSRHYVPPFANYLVGFVERDMVSHVVTRPRFAPQLCWMTCASGGGTDSDESVEADT